MEKERKTLSKKTLRKAWMQYAFFCETGYNWLRMQGMAFAQMMVPVAKELYTDDDERKAMIKREMEFFNTEPEIGQCCHGLAVAMEEQKANGEPITGEMITSVKSSLMGPLAGLGDTIIQGVIIPVLLAICIDMSLNGIIIGPVIYFIAIVAITGTISYLLFMFSYYKGNEAVLKMMSSGILDKVLKGANIMGCTVMGALIATYVSLKCGIVINASDVEYSIQTQLFDAILPSLLPLLLTLGVYKAFKKGKSAMQVILALVIGGTILFLLGIIA